MKYVIYNLKWDGAVGEQPYQKCAEYGATLDGGYIVNDGSYFGYLTGTVNQCANSILFSSAWNMEEKTEQQALAYWQSIIPENTITTSFGDVKYYGEAYIGEDGKIKQDLFNEQQ